MGGLGFSTQGVRLIASPSLNVSLLGKCLSKRVEWRIRADTVHGIPLTHFTLTTHYYRNPSYE